MKPFRPANFSALSRARPGSRLRSALFALAALLGLNLLSSPSLAAVWQPQAVPAAASAKSEPEAAALTPVVPVYFRCFIRVPDAITSRAPVDLLTDSALFSFADFPGPFSIFLNGQIIAEGLSLPAEPRRRFKIPKGILEKKRYNVLAVRLGGNAAQSGLTIAPILHGYHDELVLTGFWERHPGEPSPADLLPITELAAPSRAVFTEKDFREASTPLAPNADLVRGQRLPPDESLGLMRAGPDLAVDLLLHEPEIAQPTHFSFDARGRLWVAQYRQYPYPAGLKMISRDKYYRAIFDRVPPPPPHHDRGRDVISVHADTDGDGVFDLHRPVLTGLNLANAVLHGRGGIWVMHTPYLLFYPDTDGDDAPDGGPEVRLAGFGLEDTHSVANGLAWGPDGWIYGAQGSTTTSHIRRPGLDPVNAPGVYYESAMVWRYHPDSRAYEIFAEGGGNNFGLEFDAEGRLYSGHNGGETRGWHFVQHGVYLKQGKDPGKVGPPANPYVFGEQPMMKSSNKITRFSHHFAIAEGAAFPPQYLNRLFNADPLHRNIVVSDRDRFGSTFATRDAEIALAADDKAFRPVFIANAPDGALYIADFYEEYIAHGQNYQGQIDPDSGRIYRLRGKTIPLNRDVNLAARTAPQLLAALSHPNKWHRQTAVRLLAERRDPLTREPLLALLRPAPNAQTHPALEALWTLHQCGWLDMPAALAALDHPSAPVRAWTIRLAGDNKRLPEEFAASVARLAAAEPDAEVRCQIVSTARRLPVQQALALVSAVLRRDSDAADPFIPPLSWYAIESFCGDHPSAVLALFGIAARSDSEPPTADLTAAIPASNHSLWNSALAKDYILPRLMRRFAAPGARAGLIACARLLEAAPTAAHRQALLQAFEDAFKGRAVPPLPDNLITALANAGQNSLLLEVRRGAPQAVQQSLALAADSGAPSEVRLLHLRAFGEVHQPSAVPTLLAVAKSNAEAPLRAAALASLSRYDNPAIGSEIADALTRFPAPLQIAAQNLLASRQDWTLAFLAHIDAGFIPTASVAPEVIAQIRRHENPSIQEKMDALFPTPKTVLPPNSQAAMERIEKILKTGPGNPYAGEPLFNARCAACHQLFHKGGQIGPNLTAYQRDDLGTLLPSILDPSAEIREGFANYLIETKDGRALSGFLADQDPHLIVVRGFDGQDIPIARADIADLRPAGTSLMPEGLLEDLTDQQLRDFFAFLRVPQPISR